MMYVRHKSLFQELQEAQLQFPSKVGSADEAPEPYEIRDFADVEAELQEVLIENDDMHRRNRELEEEVRDLRAYEQTAARELASAIGRLGSEIEGLKTENRMLLLTSASQRHLKTGPPGGTAAASSDKVVASASDDDHARLSLYREARLLRSEQQESRSIIGRLHAKLEKLRALVEREREAAFERERRLSARCDDLRAELVAEREGAMNRSAQIPSSSCCGRPPRLSPAGALAKNDVQAMILARERIIDSIIDAEDAGAPDEVIKHLSSQLREVQHSISGGRTAERQPCDSHLWF